jgi:DNA-binding NtrC family response regulator
VIAELQRHAWPGNVRELAGFVERCLALEATPPEPPPEAAPDATRPLRADRERLLRRLERAYLEQLLAAHGGNVGAAARAAGVDRIQLYRLLSRAGLPEHGTSGGAPGGEKAR